MHPGTPAMERSGTHSDEYHPPTLRLALVRSSSGSVNECYAVFQRGAAAWQFTEYYRTHLWDLKRSPGFRRLTNRPCAPSA